MTESIHGFPIGAQVKRMLKAKFGSDRKYIVHSYEDWVKSQRANGESPYPSSFMESYVPVLEVGAGSRSVTGLSPVSITLDEPISKPTVLKCRNCGGRWVQETGYPKTRCSYCEA